MKKSKGNYGGEGQLPMNFDSWIPVSLKPTKASLENRLAMAESIVLAGDADYARLFALYSSYKAVAALKHSKGSYIGDVWVTKIHAQAVVRFIDTWKARRGYMLDEIRDLKHSIKNLE